MANGELVLRTEVDIKQAQKNLEKLKKELEKYDNEAKQLTKQKAEITGSESFKKYREELRQLLAEYKKTQSTINYKTDANVKRLVDETTQGNIERINKEYADTINSLTDIETKLKDIDKAQKQTNNLAQEYKTKIDEAKQKTYGIGDGFEKGIKSLKKFALSLFGIRSMFSLVRRATSAYLSEHEDTANKINAIWVALGNALAPIIEAIADGVLKLIGYLNVFLQALGFDVDLTKNMNKTTKAVNGTTKAMKELNRQTASFDEMNIQSKDTSTSGSGGASSGTNGFTMPELDEGIVNKLKDIAKWLKENKDLLLAIGTIIAGYKVLKWLGGISSLIGGGSGAGATGLLGLSNILNGLLAMELIAITISVIYFGMQLNELRNTNDELERFYNNNTKNSKEVNKNNREMVETTEKGSKAINDYVNELNEQIKTSKTSIDAKKQENDEMGVTGRLLESVTGTRKKNNAIIEEQIQRIINNASELQKLAQQGKLTDDQMKTYNQTMKYLNETQAQLGDEIKGNVVSNGTFADSLNKTKTNLYDQIEALKSTETQTKTTTDNQKNAYNNLWTTTRDIFRNIDNLKANPTVEVKANTKKLTSIIDTITKMPGLSSSEISSFTWVGNTLKKFGLAKGGIVNLPGKGVPLGNIVTGEATNGAEGVIPMNNAESMALIGESIAKHVVINLTNTTMLDNKVIAREQRKINDSTNFATNGRGVL